MRTRLPRGPNQCFGNPNALGLRSFHQSLLLSTSVMTLQATTWLQTCTMGHGWRLLPGWLAWAKVWISGLLRSPWVCPKSSWLWAYSGLLSKSRQLDLEHGDFKLKHINSILMYVNSVITLSGSWICQNSDKNPGGRQRAWIPDSSYFKRHWQVARFKNWPTLAAV